MMITLTIGYGEDSSLQGPVSRTLHTSGRENHRHGVLVFLEPCGAAPPLKMMVAPFHQLLVFHD
jgi:hypothetical protein